MNFIVKCIENQPITLVSVILCFAYTVGMKEVDYSYVNNRIYTWEFALMLVLDLSSHYILFTFITLMLTGFNRCLLRFYINYLNY